MAGFLYRLGKLQFIFIRIGLELVLVARILVYDLRTLTNPLVRAKKTLGGPFLCNGKLKKWAPKTKTETNSLYAVAAEHSWVPLLDFL